MSRRFSYKTHCYKLSDECFNLHMRCRQLEGMLAMATLVAVYTGLRSSGAGLQDYENHRQVVEDLRAALRQWAESGGGPPTGELETMVNKLLGKS